MAASEILDEACAKLPHTKRAMFGGFGYFAPNGGMFAGIVDEDAIVLKFADEDLRASFEKVGGKAWVYKGKQGSMTMKEWILVPADLYDEPRTLAGWAAKAHAAAPAKKAKATKAKSSPKKAPAKKTAKKR